MPYLGFSGRNDWHSSTSSHQLMCFLRRWVKTTQQQDAVSMYIMFIQTKLLLRSSRTGRVCTGVNGFGCSAQRALEGQLILWIQDATKRPWPPSVQAKGDGGGLERPMRRHSRGHKHVNINQLDKYMSWKGYNLESWIELILGHKKRN